VTCQGKTSLNQPLYLPGSRATSCLKSPTLGVVDIAGFPENGGSNDPGPKELP
jgi:hypothetical protein